MIGAVGGWSGVSFEFVSASGEKVGSLVQFYAGGGRGGVDISGKGGGAVRAEPGETAIVGSSQGHDKGCACWACRGGMSGLPARYRRRRRRKCAPADTTVACVHYVGFRGDEYGRARRLWGGPAFIHRKWDRRAQRDVGPDDLVIFATGDEHQPLAQFNGEDLDERWLSTPA